MLSKSGKLSLLALTLAILFILTPAAAAAAQQFHRQSAAATHFHEGRGRGFHEHHRPWDEHWPPGVGRSWGHYGVWGIRHPY